MVGKIRGNINEGLCPEEPTKKEQNKLVALEVGLAKAVQMLIPDRWVVDTRFHAEKTGVQRPPERPWLNRLTTQMASCGH